MNQAQQTIKVLVIESGGTASSHSDWLGASVEVATVDSFDEARALLANGQFRYVIASPETFSLETALSVCRPCANLAAEGEGVGIIDAGGELVWANCRLLRFPEEVCDFTRAKCAKVLASETLESADGDSDQPQSLRFTLRRPDGGVFELTATPVLDKDGGVRQVVAVVRDATQVRARQEKLAAVDHAGRELVRLDQEQVSSLDTAERLALLEQKIVRYLHDLMHFDNFSIHILDKKTNKLEMALSSGMPETVEDFDLYALPEGNGIAGYVAHYGRSYNCPDVSKDPRYLKGLDEARSSLTVPLRLNDEVIGVLNVESNQLAAFDDQGRQLAEMLGPDIATALHILDLLVVERFTTTGQLGSHVLAEVTEPLNDIMTDVENLVEDYIGHDDLRHRLNRITNYALAVREAIKRVTSPKGGVLGHRPTAVRRHDPILTGKKLLIADDEVMIRETVRDVLASYGCEVQVVENGNQAVELIRNQRFDLVLSDIKMPGRNGYEVFAAAKDAHADTPVILMTGFGYDPNHAIVRARREGLAAVLFKPFKVDQLLGEIRAVLHTSSG
ncbi:MAG: response regulator [Phycisphaerae bacterium]